MKKHWRHWRIRPYGLRRNAHDEIYCRRLGLMWWESRVSNGAARQDARQALRRELDEVFP